MHLRGVGRLWQNAGWDDVGFFITAIDRSFVHEGATLFGANEFGVFLNTLLLIALNKLWDLWAQKVENRSIAGHVL